MTGAAIVDVLLSAWAVQIFFITCPALTGFGSCVDAGLLSLRVSSSVCLVILIATGTGSGVVSAPEGKGGRKGSTELGGVSVGGVAVMRLRGGGVFSGGTAECAIGVVSRAGRAADAAGGASVTGIFGAAISAIGADGVARDVSSPG